tara:strand:+ start:125 stop:334 length:210 start_codon:yes stop_codon:yes gene_type:complete
MISSVLGAVIMSAATVAMLITLNFTTKVLKEVGRDPLREKERNILIDAGFDFSDIDLINQEIETLNFED